MLIHICCSSSINLTHFWLVGCIVTSLTLQVITSSPLNVIRLEIGPSNFGKTNTPLRQKPIFLKGLCFLICVQINLSSSLAIYACQTFIEYILLFCGLQHDQNQRNLVLSSTDHYIFYSCSANRDLGKWQLPYVLIKLILSLLVSLLEPLHHTYSPQTSLPF